MALFTIVVPTYNNRIQLENCLNSILKIDSVDYKVVVCDNGSKDGTIEFMQQFVLQHPQFQFSEHPDKQNKGRAANRNQALRFVDTEYILFLDSDAYVSKQILEEHSYVLSANSNAASIGKTLYTNSKTNDWAAYLAKRGHGKFQHLAKTDYKYFNTQNSAMPSRFFVELAGFDAHMFHYGGDDIEFGCRLKKVFNPDFVVNEKAIVYSEMDKSLDQALGQMEEFGRINLRYIHNKHPELLDIFHMHLFLAKTLKGFIFRSILNDSFGNLILFWLPIFPSKWKIQWINYLVALRIKKGFLSKQKH